MNKLSTENYANMEDLSTITTYQAGILQASTHRILQKHCDTILKKYGLSKMQWLIIGTVYDSGKKGIRLTDLAKKLDTTMSYITVTINLLHSMGVISRKENGIDSRSKLVSIDKDFMPKCAEIEKTMRESLRKSLYVHIKPEDLKVYLRVLYQLTALDKNNR